MFRQDLQDFLDFFVSFHLPAIASSSEAGGVETDKTQSPSAEKAKLSGQTAEISALPRHQMDRNL
jgi:hypothetical protein